MLRAGFLAAAAAVAFATAAAADGAPSLLKLVEYAEARHGGYLAQRADAAAAAEDPEIARAALLPQASAVFRDDWKNDDSWMLDLSASQPLLDLSALAEYRAAQDQNAVSEANLAGAGRALRRDVVLAWLDAQQAADVLELVAARQRTLREQLNRVTLLLSAGRATETDVLSARAGLASARSQWAQAQHDLATALEGVEYYAGAPVRALVLAASASDLPPPQPLEYWRKRVEQNSISAEAARARVLYLQGLLDAAKLAALPRAVFTAGAQAKSGGNVSQSLGVNISQSLFTGGAITARKRQIVALLEAARWRLADTKRGEEREVRRLHGQMRANLASLAALGEQARAAAALLEAVIVGYNNGVRIAEEVIAAEEDLFNARLDERREAYKYLSNWVALKTLAAEADDAFIAQIEGYFAPASGGKGG